MRSKEEAFDYRYFPEPDIPALEPSAEWIEDLRAALPELPRARRDRYVDELGLKPEVARVLVGDRAACVLFEETVALGADPAAAANWMTQDLAGFANKQASRPPPEVTPRHLADLLRAARRGDDLRRRREAGARGRRRDRRRRSTRSSSVAACDRSPTPASSARSSTRCSPSNADAARSSATGNEGVIGFLVGQVMKASGGSANPKLAQELLRERLQG